MPYVRKPKRTTKKPRKTALRYRSKIYKKPIFKPQNLIRLGFPKTTAVKLRYVCGIKLDPAAATLATQTFRANSVFQPEITGGHQPMNFDMWASLYNHYVVIGSKIKAIWNINSSVATAGGLVYGITLSDDTIHTTNVTAMMEQGLARWKIQDAIWANGGKAPTATSGFSCKKFFNLVNPTDNITRVGAGVGANPSDPAIFTVFCGTPPANTTANMNEIDVQIIIDYIVIFSEPKEQPLS